MKTCFGMKKIWFLALTLMGFTLTATAADPSNESLGLLSFQSPEFPRMAVDQGILSGRVFAAISWDDQGAPAEVVVLGSSHSLFEAPTTEALHEWRRAPQSASRVASTYEFRFEVSGIVVFGGKSINSMMVEKTLDHTWRVTKREELDVEPRALVQPMPVFPAQARSTGQTGRVVVNFFVDAAGKVKVPTVEMATADIFVPNALAAIRQWRFAPPRRDGRPTFYAERWAFDFGPPNG